MITEKNATAINNSGLSVNRFNLVMTPEVFKVFYSSLYEDKETAVLRELVSNGDDGHTKAGVKNVPVVIHLPTKLVPELVVIDQGSGMSLEDISTIYTTYGKSSKRDSNDEIGGFGYGAKSPFAISQSFTVETTKDGVTTSFVNFIDKDGPNYTILSSTHTGKPSGTTVKVPVADEQRQLSLSRKASEGLFALWETQPIIKNATTNIEVKYKIIDRKPHFIEMEVSHYGTSLLSYVSSGPFMYKIPVNMMDRIRQTPDYAFISAVYDTSHSFNGNNTRVSALPRFNVGELELSPSRERIEDTVENENRIKARLAEIKATLSVPVLKTVDQFAKAYELAEKYGVKVSDLIGPVDNDYIITFKDPDQLLAEILPAGWEPTSVNLAAACFQYNTDDVHYYDRQLVPNDISKFLVTGSNIATRWMVSRSVVDKKTSLFNYPMIIKSLKVDKENVNEKLVNTVVSELKLVSRIHKSYRSTRRFVDKQTFIFVREKAKLIVSRCLNHVSTNWVNPSVLFSDDHTEALRVLEKTAQVLGYTFNYVYEEEVKKLNKTIPKATRTVTKIARAKVDRKVARLYLHDSRDLQDVLESEAAGIIARQKIMVCVINDPSNLAYCLDSRIKYLLKSHGIQLLFMPEKEYTAKKYISDIFDGIVETATIKKCKLDTRDLQTEVIKFIATLPKGKESLEEVVAITVLDEQSYNKLYPTASLSFFNIYTDFSRYFGIYLQNKTAASMDIRCKWAGYETFQDVKELSQVMNATEMAFVKTALGQFAQSQLKY